MGGVLDLWLVRLILLLRPDLRSSAQSAPEKFAWWLINAGQQEYCAVAQSAELRSYFAAVERGTNLSRLERLVYAHRPDVRKAYPMQRGTEQFRQWYYQHGVSEHRLWAFLDEGQRLLAAMFSDLDAVSTVPACEGPSARPFGVNLIGYAYGQLGIGEDLRMAAKALHAARVPVAVIDFPPGAGIGQDDGSIDQWVRATGPYRYNIFCLTALEHGRYFAERGIDQIAGRHNIGYWPWELERWPPEWQGLFRLVDEVWVSSRHTLGAVSQVAPVPSRLMPMAVQLGPISRKQRAAFGLPKQACLFCFAFDLNSSIHRKNAAACLEAFSTAFPSSQCGPAVGLVLKCQRPSRPDALWKMLKAKALADPRIHIFEQTMPRSELLALYRSCDCFVSLHRAEGFGRNIAEALQLGLHVITTGYSGNTDFCRSRAADLVGYRLIPVEEGQYPFAAGAVWADPDIAEAAAHMSRFASGRSKRQRRDQLPPRYAVPAVGARYRERLEQLEADLSHLGSVTLSAEATGAT